MASLEVDEIKEIISEIGLALQRQKSQKMAEQIISNGGEIIPDWDF